MSPAIAVVGMACRYPDARSPAELWENVLAQRRAFRRIPAERLRAEDYLSEDRDAPDRTYVAEAALLADYDFDRVGFRVAGTTFRSADLVHWLALDVAAQALADAGFPEGEGLPRDSTGVLLGNTLTGEFSRANVMRLRWPYVRRVIDAALMKEDWSLERRRTFLQDLETQYKAPFPPIGEESLAGSLSNTIAGRICNYFDLKGGGYTVDGACASSLLAATTACSALVAGDLDVALAGGVDLSLDPFELVGFAKTGALAPEKMRVYDARSAGFWPGEGCGLVVLMRYADALAQDRRIYAVIRGWGVSSDGSGGITRPEVEGQSLALRRAYRRAGFGMDTVAYFEGHGTGTSVGDATELQALSRARREIAPEAPPAAIGSIKANIGHTKAAAGVAGLIKTTMAVHAQILPPTTGCEQPHPVLTGEAPALRVLNEGEPWPADMPLRAGASAMGFGGINTHLVLEGVTPERRRALGSRERILLSSPQDAELFLLSAPKTAELQYQVEHLLTLAPRLSRAELTDLAAQLARTLNVQSVRAAVVASSPQELANRLETLRAWLEDRVSSRLDIHAGAFIGADDSEPRIGFLFPGQASPAHLSGGVWRWRFEHVRELYARANLPSGGDGVATEVAQSAIVTASLAALRVLDQLGIHARLGVGHSLGELTALHWAGALDETALLRIAAARGSAMAALSAPTGAMASIGAGRKAVEALLDSDPISIACLNSPLQTVVSGEAAAVDSVIARAETRGLRVVKLPVSHAFHSPLVAAAAQPLEEHLADEDFRPLQRTVISTVTGAPLTPENDLRALLYRQVTEPVRFTEAITSAIEDADLLIEVGPGRVLSGLVAECVDTPVVALDVGGPSLRGLLRAVGATFALGAPLNHSPLFADRFTRPFDLDWRPSFFVNPCELAPAPEDSQQLNISLPQASTGLSTPAGVSAQPDATNGLPEEDALSLVRRLVAKRVELPISAVGSDDNLLTDLHLNSITVSQLVAEAARRRGLPPPVALTEYANATVAEVAQALEELSSAEGTTLVGEARVPAGVDTWIRTFTVELVERPRPRRHVPAGTGVWRVIAPSDHPLAEPLHQALTRSEGSGVVVCLPPEPDEHHVGLLLDGTRAALEAEGATRFILVQHGGSAAAFARTLHLETPQVTTCVVDVPPGHPQAVEWVVAEALAATRYTEAHYDDAGQRREPVLRLLPTERELETLPLGPDDVLLVTGGGKGITAECALSLAQATGARLAVMGRSQPTADTELAGNLERMAAAGVQFRYIAADVTDAEAVGAVVREVETELGPITGILHGAARNVPQRLNTLDEETCRRTLAPKIQGARNILAAVDTDRLRLFVTFGSIIARTGLPGEADYGLANEWLTRLTERFQAQHPACRCLAVEWSVWSGIGMGERLSRIDTLVRQGITPIPTDEGVSILHRLLSQRLPTVAVVVTGRFGEPPTLQFDQPGLPFLRFLEHQRVYCPGVELIVDAESSGQADPYLDDHVFQGERLLPAVMGLEAMAQAAMAVVGAVGPPVIEDVSFNRPVVVPEDAPVTIRIAALARDPDRVEVVLRSEETAFQADHFRAMCRFAQQNETNNTQSVDLQDLQYAAREFPLLGINPDRDLYGGLLFHSGRFQRLRGYRRLAANECIAEIGPDGPTAWFSRYLPSRLVLGDPGARDAALHAIQACIPHAVLLPVGVERLVPAAIDTSGPWRVHARERSRVGDTFTYDVKVMGADGHLCECWEGLRLQMVSGTAFHGPWAAPLLGPYVERRVQELIPGSAVTVTVEWDGSAARRLRSERAIQHALRKITPVRRRTDGKPEAEGLRDVSASHAGDLTLAVAGLGPIGCDIEPVVHRPTPVWRDLVGQDRFALARVIFHEAREDAAAAVTRVWAAGECLKKAGLMADAPLVLVTSTEDGWVLLSSGVMTIATFVAQVREVENRLTLAVLVGSDNDAASL